jgi:uncharacterized protein with HEPN domain
MLESIARIHHYIQGTTETQFQQNFEKQDAVVRRLEVLGEAATQLPAEWRARHPGIPWRIIADTRNRLIHGYFNVDISIVWQTISQDIGPLEIELRKILASEFSPPSAPPTP